VVKLVLLPTGCLCVSSGFKRHIGKSALDIRATEVCGVILPHVVRAGVAVIEQGGSIRPDLAGAHGILAAARAANAARAVAAIKHVQPYCQPEAFTLRRCYLCREE
jgi:hypothetical protein